MMQEERQEIDTAMRVGLLANSGKAAWHAYRERSEVAKRKGITLLLIEPHEDNIRRLSEGDRLLVRYWNGKSMLEALAQPPEVYYDRTGMRSRSRRRQSDLINTIQQRNYQFINSPAFREICADKWTTYQFFAQNNLPTPVTALYSPESLEDMLDATGFVFVKKRISSEGRNQIVIKDVGNEAYLMSPSDAKEPRLVNGLATVADILQSDYSIGSDYIVQEGIRVDRIGDRVYDFRALFQRGRSGSMGMTAFYVRVGAMASDQSNIGKKGHPHDPSVIFENYGELQRDVRSFGQRIIKAISKSHVIGEVGLDFVTKEDGGLMVLEANTKPGSKGLRTLREWKPTDPEYAAINVIPYKYDNHIREHWGDRLNAYLSKPFHYAKYLISTRLS